MATQGFDGVRYKSDQRQSWGSSAAGWSRWWATIDKGAQDVSDRLVELAGIQPGHNVRHL